MSLTYSIGEAAAIVGASAETLRVWEQQGLIAPPRTTGGVRRYTDEHLVRLRRIQYLRRVERLNLPAIARVLRGEAAATTTVGPMSPPSDLAGIGQRLRTERQRAALTLRQVAERARISVSYLSAIERGINAPSIATLHTLMRVYGLTVRDLLVDRNRTGRLVRAGERPAFPNAPEMVRIEQLALGPVQMEPQIFRVPPGTGSDGAYRHAGEEFIFVLRGVLEIWLDEREHYTLAPGDCLYFPSTLAHRWWNPAGEEAELLWVNTPPTF